MKFHKQILSKINKQILDEALLYLLGIRYNINTNIIPDRIKREVNMLGIMERNLETDTILWVVPLFEGEEHIWDWVLTYRELFRNVRKDAGGTVESCTRRMEKYFRYHPSIRSKDIIEATKLYIEPFIKGGQDPRYLQRADYFIYKGVGNNATSRLEEYLEILKEQESLNTSGEIQTFIPD